MSSVASSGSVVAPLPFRLRTVLGLLLVGGGLAFAVPRAKAAWRLHGVVGKVADYGLCMAGPTGAIAVRDDTVRFRLLVRRRLVASPANDMPFARCANLASEISGRSDLAQVHRQMASDFIEWGGGGQKQSVNELLGATPDLAQLHAAAWPFARKELPELIRPSRGAYEAVHPMEPVRPTPVRGLLVDGAVTRSTLETPKGRYVVFANDRDVWALRSRDRGQSWAPTSAWQSALEGHARHCVADEMGTRFTLASPRSGGSPALLQGTISGVGTMAREFGTPLDTVLRLACDSSGAVLLTQRRAESDRMADGSRRETTSRRSDSSYHVYACALAGACREVPLPVQAKQRDVFVDVARVARTIVVAISKDGLVRVTTSRDEGASMTPPSLVFDARDVRVPGLDTSVVPTLLAFDKHLTLTLAAPLGSTRWALESQDYGASFHGG